MARVASDCLRVVCSPGKGKKRQIQLKWAFYPLKVRSQHKCTKCNNASSLNPAQCFAHSRYSINVLN